MSAISCSYNEFRAKVSDKGADNKITMSILGWKDWDHFEAICYEDDGGLEKCQKDLYVSMPVILGNLSTKEVEMNLDKFRAFPYLSSVGGKVKYYYDIHLWIKKDYIIYNPYLEKIINLKPSFLKRIIGWVYAPEWIEE